MSEVVVDHAEDAVPVHALYEEDVPGFLDGRQAFVKAFAELSDFKGKAGQVLVTPNTEGGIDRVLFGLGDRADAQTFRALAAKLPAGEYRIASAPAEISPEQIALAFALGSYRFDRYKKKKDDRPRLVAGEQVDVAEVRSIAHACALARDMVNTPPNDMGPLQIETIAREIAEQYGASITVVTGEGLLEANYPAVHAVGRAAVPHRAPRMIEISWGEAGKPLIALVGKGVVFDTGGLDIKPAAGMRNMKKDMGGAAHAIALAGLVMAQQLPVQLTLVVAAVENAVGPDAFRPGEVITTRKGITVEIDNTDAEGRLVLCDALTYVSEQNPDTILDFATLTGAARIALGPDLPALFANDDTLANQWLQAGDSTRDPVWRMPLWRPYLRYLNSGIADLANAGSRMAGSVTAALYLERFINEGQVWAHLDVYAWNDGERPGRPAGGEALALRSAWAMLKTRYGS